MLELQRRVAELFGHEDALFTPTGSMANVLAVASLVAPGQEVLCEASAHIARAELGAHGAVTGLTMRTWRDPRGQVDLAAVQDLYAPDMGPFFVRTTAVSVENTHNFAGGAVLPLDGPAGPAHLGGLGRRGRPPRRGADLERARRDRRPARGVRRVRRRDGGVPLQGPRRAGGLARRGHDRRDGRGAGTPQADGRRDASGRACWPPPGSTRSTTTSTGSPTTTRNARLLAEACGVDPDDRRHQHRRRPARRRGRVRRRRAGGRRARRAGRATRRTARDPPRRQRQDAQTAAGVLARL